MSGNLSLRNRRYIHLLVNCWSAGAKRKVEGKSAKSQYEKDDCRCDNYCDFHEAIVKLLVRNGKRASAGSVS